MTDYTTLERLAYINGKPDLAALYATAAMVEGLDSDTLIEITEIGLDKIKEAEYERGKRDASDAELLAQINRLTTDVKQKDENFAELLGAFDNFLKWLGTDAAKTITNRRQGVKTIQTWLRKWK